MNLIMKSNGQAWPQLALTAKLWMSDALASLTVSRRHIDMFLYPWLVLTGSHRVVLKIFDRLWPEVIENQLSLGSLSVVGEIICYFSLNFHSSVCLLQMVFACLFIQSKVCDD